MPPCFASSLARAENKEKSKTSTVVLYEVSCSAEGFTCSGMLEVCGVQMPGALGHVAVPLPIFRSELCLSGAFRNGYLWMPLFAKKQRLLLLFISLESGGGDGCCVSRLGKLFAASPCLWDSHCAPL